ncbi:MAG: hypothetical protein GY696_13625 [Gammaproteobacteria bacterium]|nr:hypothetical protein [Gammaproteobacteria bacterium]
MIRHYDMAAGEWVTEVAQSSDAETGESLRDDPLMHPALALQELQPESDTRAAKLPPGLASKSVDSILDSQT